MAEQMLPKLLCKCKCASSVCDRARQHTLVFGQDHGWAQGDQGMLRLRKNATSDEDRALRLITCRRLGIKDDGKEIRVSMSHFDQHNLPTGWQPKSFATKDAAQLADATSYNGDVRHASEENRVADLLAELGLPADDEDTRYIKGPVTAEHELLATVERMKIRWNNAMQFVPTNLPFPAGPHHASQLCDTATASVATPLDVAAVGRPTGPSYARSRNRDRYYIIERSAATNAAAATPFGDISNGMPTPRVLHTDNLTANAVVHGMQQCGLTVTAAPTLAAAFSLYTPAQDHPMLQVLEQCGQQRIVPLRPTAMPPVLQQQYCQPVATDTPVNPAFVHLPTQTTWDTPTQVATDDSFANLTMDSANDMSLGAPDPFSDHAAAATDQSMAKDDTVEEIELETRVDTAPEDNDDDSVDEEASACPSEDALSEASFNDAMSYNSALDDTQLDEVDAAPQGDDGQAANTASNPPQLGQSPTESPENGGSGGGSGQTRAALDDDFFAQLDHMFTRNGSEETIQVICERKNFDEDAIRQDRTFDAILGHVRRKFPDFNHTVIQNGKTLLICQTPDTEGCKKFHFRDYRVSAGTLYLCANRKCRRAYESMQRRLRRLRQREREGNVPDPTKPDSHCPWKFLSPDQFKKRMRRHKDRTKYLKSKALRLSRLLADKEELIVDLKRGDKDKVVNELREVLQYCSDPKKAAEIRKEIVTLLIDTHKSYTGHATEQSEKELQAYADQIICTFDNYSKRLAGKTRQVRFNSNVMRTALTIWLNSQSAYERARSSSIEVLPSARTLFDLQRKLISREGIDPMRYAHHQDETRHLVNHNWIATIYFDEMDTRSDVRTNVNNNKTDGFAQSETEFLDKSKMTLSEELHDLYRATVAASDTEDKSGFQDASSETAADDTEPSPDKAKDDGDGDDDEGGIDFGLAKKVHFFRLKDHSKHAMNLEFFLNSGSLTGSSQLLQLLQVIFHCELIGIKIFQVCGDAGGSNTSMYSMLREVKRDSLVLGQDVEWLDDKACSFRNPVDKNRRIYITPCSVHLMKAMRNNLLKSQKNLAREFKFNDVEFGWAHIIELFFSDQKPRRTDLTPSNINPDKNSLMNVRDAQAPFTYNTITYMCSLIANSLSGYSAKQLAKDLHLVEKEMKFESRGFDAEKLDAALKILKERVEQTEGVSDELRSKLATLEYCIAVHGIFNARFLNYKAVLVKALRPNQPRVKNARGFHYLEFDTELLRMKAYLDYFQIWREQAKERKVKGDGGKWELTCLAEATRLNLVQTISGFMSYARAVLTMEGGPTYVPYRLANQSTVENIFSQLRGARKDTPLTIAKGVLAIDVAMALSTDHLRAGRSYPWQLVKASETKFDGMSMMDCRRDEERAKILDEWLKERTEVLAERLATEQAGDTDDIRRDSSNSSNENSSSTNNGGGDEAPAGSAFEHWRKLLFPRGDVHFTDILLEDKIFKETVMAAVFSDSKEFFHKLLTLPSTADELAFDDFCHRVVDCQLESIINAKRDHSTGQTMLEFLLHDDFDRRMEALPHEELNDRCGMGLVTLTVNRLLIGKVRDALKAAAKEKKAQQASLATTEESKEVYEAETKMLINRFVGYGLAELIKAAGRQADSKEEEDVELQERIKFFRSMRIFHEQALFAPGYAEEYYDDVLALQNHGFLALLAPEYMQFGYKLMSIVRQAIYPDRIPEDGSEVLKDIKAELDRHIEDLMDALEVGIVKQQPAMQVDMATKEYAVRYIVSKVCHAYFGCCLEDVRKRNTKKFGKHYKPGNLRTLLRVLSANTGSIPEFIVEKAAAMAAKTKSRNRKSASASADAAADALVGSESMADTTSANAAAPGAAATNSTATRRRPAATGVMGMLAGVAGRVATIGRSAATRGRSAAAGTTAPASRKRTNSSAGGGNRTATRSRK